MVMDQVFAQTRTKSFTTEENGEFIVVDPGSQGIIITDIQATVRLTGDIESVKPNFDFDLILQIGDGANRFELADIDVEKNSVYQYKSVGLVKYWNGGRFEVLKNFAGKLCLTISYIRLTGLDWSIWSQR